ncbi:hypothetical protein J8L98_16460 [Pseudoalteromonas sp. MMG013]|nr:hypothetical protein [Pseudoalteromonas sp. MMG013]MBQ4863278.1 hypothetical protein [Pseudoalteromonas sp. MMG013]
MHKYSKVIENNGISFSSEMKEETCWIAKVIKMIAEKLPSEYMSKLK